MSQWVEFDMLKQLTGTAYQQQRDSILKSTPDLKLRVKSYQARPDWQDRVTARILEGWADHGQLYTQVLAELDAVDVQRESTTVVGISGVWDDFALRAKTQYKEMILPLCWEVLLKFVNVWPDWKLITFLRMAAVLPDDLSVEPVLYLMQQTHSSGARDMAGRVLQTLPASAAKSAVKEHLKTAEEEAQRDPAAEVKTRPLRKLLRDVLERIERP